MTTTSSVRRTSTPDDDFDSEIDDAIESVTGMRYDPEVAPDPSGWQALGEDERIMLAETYHRRAGIEVPNMTVHATVHAIIENQVAMGDELPTHNAIERLMGEGLDRHDAVHAVASVLAAHINDALRAGSPNIEAYNDAVERLTAESWRADFEPGGRRRLTSDVSARLGQSRHMTLVPLRD